MSLFTILLLVHPGLGFANPGYTLFAVSCKLFTVFS